MSTIRQQVRDAFVEALNNGRAPDIPEAKKRRWRMGRSACPHRGVFFLEEITEVPRALGRHGPLVNRGLQIAVQCVAASDDPGAADDLVEPMLTDSTKRLAGINLSGLALDVIETRTLWETVEDDKFYVAATQVWTVNIQTKRDDPERKQ